MTKQQVFSGAGVPARPTENLLAQMGFGYFSIVFIWGRTLKKSL
jgi:hypothetical protein